MIVRTKTSPRDSGSAPRKSPKQARSKQTVEAILEGAARVFRREGFAATTNRIAEEAGVSIGTLYEWFPNKESLLVALAEQHVCSAEHGVGAALTENDTRALLASLQRAIVASHRYPSQAIDLVARVPGVGVELLKRVRALRARVLTALAKHAAARGLDDPDGRARAAFAVIGELTSRSSYADDAPEHERLARHWLEMAVASLGADD